MYSKTLDRQTQLKLSSNYARKRNTFQGQRNKREHRRADKNRIAKFKKGEENIN